jgi:hypothetical protein
MLNWHDKVGLSQNERRRVKKLATSGLDRALIQLSRTRAMLEAMSRPDPERDALLARVRAEQVRVAALRRERLARVAERLPESGRIVMVGWDWLERFLSPLLPDYRMVCRNGRPVTVKDGDADAWALGDAIPTGEATGWMKQLRRTAALLSIRRGGEFLKLLGTRTLAKRRARCGAARLARSPQRILTRSVASRSRVVAPVCAPPLIS